MAIKAGITFADRPNVTHWYRIPQSRFGPMDVLYDIYDDVMRHTDSHDESEEASSWVDMACVGETYETDSVFIEIIDDDDY